MAHALTLTTTAFQPGDTIPTRYTCDGEDLSPPLSWAGVPEGTLSLVLLCDDPDAPRGTWTHWVLYGIQAGMSGLPEGVPTHPALSWGGKQGRNSWGQPGYGGPCPPPGPAHRYFFKLYALDDTLDDLGPGQTPQQLLGRMAGHILDQAELMGRYARRR